jgi:hypothetical protein
LKSHGIETAQYDLNEEFAQFLIRDPMLRRLCTGEVTGVPLDSVAAASARWISRNALQLFDDRGRHLFGTDRITRGGLALDGRAGPGANSYSYVLEMLAQPFTINPDAEQIASIRKNGDGSAVYWDFYEQSAFAKQLELDTALIGISVPMGPQLVPSLVLAKHLKQERPGIPIVLGGPTLSLMAKEDIEALLRRHTEVDCIVQFDGEYPLLKLSVQALAGKWDPAGVDGVSSLQDGNFRHNKSSAGPNVNDIPPPDYPLDALDRLAEPILGITQARGCYWGKCDYCDFVELFEGSPPFRSRRPDNFVDEIEYLIARTGVNRFRFITESIPPGFARRTSELLLKRDIRIKWSSFAMVERHFDRPLFALMVEAGCEFLVVGLESMNTRVLNLVHKSANREANHRFLKDAKAAGMKLKINLIPDLPSTTYEEAINSLADVEKLLDCVEDVSDFPFEPTRSSSIGRHPERFGLLIDSPASTRGQFQQSQYALNHLNSKDPAMSDDMRAEVHLRYRKFANAVKTRNRTGTLLPTKISEQGLFRIPVEDLDIFPVEDRLICTQIRTRERVTISRLAAELLKPYLSGHPFTLKDLRTRAGDQRAEILARNLEEASMVMSVRGS